MSLGIPGWMNCLHYSLLYSSVSRTAGDKFRSMRESPAQVKYNGAVSWGYTVMAESSCAVDMRLFPFDTQRCFIHYATLTSLSWLINLRPGHPYIRNDFLTENGQFNIISTSVESYLLEQDNISASYPSITFAMDIQRRPSYYVLNMLLPCFALTLLGLMAYCMPVASGERISLQVTLLLSFGMFQMMLAEHIPNNATRIPILSKYRKLFNKNGISFLSAHA